MELKFAAITDSDLELIKDTAANKVKFSDLKDHEFFGQPIQLIKFTSVLSIVREDEKIANYAALFNKCPKLQIMQHCSTDA